MDAPLVLPNRSTGGPENIFTVNFTDDGYPEQNSFGSGHWLWPESGPQPGVRTLYVKGCGSSCHVEENYYTAITTRIAKHSGGMVLATNYADYPEQPYPMNVRSILADLRDCLANDLPEGQATGHCFLACDSVGCLTLMLAVMALQEPGTRDQLGVPDDLTIANVTGLGLFSPVLDINCETKSMFQNGWDPAKNIFHAAGYAYNESTSLTHEQRRLDCRDSYLRYFGGIEAVQRLSKGGWEFANVERELQRWAPGFWTSPSKNPLHADLTGFPPLYVSASTGDYYGSDGQTFAKRACSAGVDVQAHIVEGLWHCFMEYSEGGCAPNATGSFIEGLESYSRWGSFVRRIVVQRKQIAQAVL